jgi:NitT/TauT family transport system substrate-binding protein
MLDLQSKGVARDDIVPMLYKDYGMDFYGNAVIAGGGFIEESPEAVAGFNRAVVKGLKWLIANPEKAVEIVAAVDPLIDQKLELERLQLALEVNILTPYVMENGVGAVDTARLENSIRQLATALDLKTTPAAADIWTDAFLPPAADRKL